MNDLFPNSISLEVTNHCNLRCRHCHFHAHKDLQRRKLGFMKPHVWIRVLDELKEINRPVYLVSNGVGEPLLYNYLPDLLKRAKKIPTISVGFMSNGMLLDKKWADRLVDLQVDFISISIDGTDATTNDYFRVNADLKLIEKNISYLIEKKIKEKSSFPKLHFNMVGYPEILYQEMSYVRKWMPVAEEVNIFSFRPIGSRKLWSGQQEIPFKPCPLLWQQMVISHEGKIGLCCVDDNDDVHIGKLEGSSLYDIYNFNPKLLFYREKHLKNELSDLLLCADCHIWAGDVILEKKDILLDDMKIKYLKTPACTHYRKT